MEALELWALTIRGLTLRVLPVQSNHSTAQDRVFESAHHHHKIRYFLPTMGASGGMQDFAERHGLVSVDALELGPDHQGPDTQGAPCPV